MTGAEEERNVEVVREMWEAYEREGLSAILAFAAPEARWRPHSAGGRFFKTTAEYGAYLREMQQHGELVEATLFDVRPHGDCVIVSGRLRLRSGEGLSDTNMHWLHRFAGGLIVETISAPQLEDVLAAGGLPLEATDRGVERAGPG